MTMYGFFSKALFDRTQAKNSEDYGAIYRRYDGKLVVCNDVVTGKNEPFGNFNDYHHHGVVTGFVRKAVHEDVKSIVKPPQKVEDPILYLKDQQK